MPRWENKAPQLEHGTLQRATPLTPKDNDKPKGPQDVQKIKLKQELGGGHKS
jgi:hypothetical protein